MRSDERQVKGCTEELMKQMEAHIWKRKRRDEEEGEEEEEEEKMVVVVVVEVAFGWNTEEEKRENVSKIRRHIEVRR